MQKIILILLLLNSFLFSNEEINNAEVIAALQNQINIMNKSYLKGELLDEEYSELKLMKIRLKEMIKSNSIHKKMPFAEALPYFESIKDLEITIGTGSEDIYVFVDPMCPHSRAFISLIHDKEEMQKKYKYHIWLYRLPKFKSIPYIYYIYNKKSSERLDLLYDIMVKENKIISLKVSNTEVIHNYKKIEAIATLMDIYKRPYLFVNKKGN